MAGYFLEEDVGRCFLNLWFKWYPIFQLKSPLAAGHYPNESSPVFLQFQRIPRVELNEFGKRVSIPLFQTAFPSATKASPRCIASYSTPLLLLFLPFDRFPSFFPCEGITQTSVEQRGRNGPQSFLGRFSLAATPPTLLLPRLFLSS